ncbi:MAG: homoserine kinase [Acidobacteria bacterium]|nr:homoserine kinase [Acidobacteriota bacterium]
MSLKSTSGGTSPPYADITVPASVANLGGGFDTLAVAVQLYLRLRIVDVREDGGAKLTVVKSTPPVRGRNAIERAYEAIARATGLQAPSVSAEADSDIPMTAGLGSSAAAAVAGLRLFERVTGPLPDGVLLSVAASLEGHADNAAAALHGGLTSVVEREGEEPIALRWRWPEELRFVVATPAVGLSTLKARAALPDMLSRQDAVFNLQRVLALVHALHTGDYDHLREAVRDRWHQRTRAALVPQLADVLALEDPAILASCLSGAGPSVALVAQRDFGRLEQLLQSIYERARCPVTVRTLAVHQVPEVVEHGGRTPPLAAAQGRAL